MATAIDKVVFQGDASQLNREMKKVKDGNDQLVDGFNRLRNVIAGVAVGAFIGNTIKTAAAMSDMAKATGSSTQSVIGFSRAIVASGGTMDRARDGLSDFTKNLGEAAAGSSELQKAFQQTGVTLQDIATLTEEEIRRKAVQGLAEMGDAAGRTSVAMRLFGESFKGVDIRSLNSQLDGFTAESGSLAQAADTSSEALRKFNVAMQDLQEKILVALQPFIEWVSKLLENREAISSIIDRVIRLASVLGTLFIIGKLTALFAALSQGMLYFNKNVSSLSPALALARTGMSSLRLTGKIFLSQLAAIRKSGTITTATIAGLAKRITFLGIAFTRFIPIIGQVYLAWEILNTAIEAVTGKDIVGWIKSIGDAFEEWTTKNFPAVAQFLNDFESSFRDFWGLQQRLSKEAAKSQIADISEIGDADQELQGNMAQRRVVINRITEALDKQLDTYKKQNESFVRTLQDEQKLLSFKGEELEAQRKILDFTNRYKDALGDLQAQLRTLQGAAVQDPAAIAAIEQAIKKLTDEYTTQLPIVEEIARAIGKQKQELDSAAEAAARLKEEMERVNDAGLKSAKFIEELENSTKDAAYELRALDMDPLQKQLSEIERDIQGKVSRRVAELQELLKQTADPQAQREIQKQIDSIEAASKRVIRDQQELARKSREHQRSFSYGWSKAMRDYVEDVTNGAKTAEKIFNTAFKGMEDALVGFAKTGKFEWKQFLAILLEELLRAQIQVLFAKLIQSLSESLGGATQGLGGGGNSFLPTGGSLGDLGNLIGGVLNPGSNQGPLGGIASSVSDIFRGATSPVGGGIGGAIGQGTSTSGGLGGIADSIGRGFGGVVDSIGSGLGKVGSAIGDGLSGLFGGGGGGGGDWWDDVDFFAHGGRIKPGQLGIVGERGPELIGGPANITPLNGLGPSQTNVTYNINAVDARSFRELVARDPSFIHAVAMQGAKNSPPGRR